MHFVFLSSPPLNFDPSIWMLLILRLLASDYIFENYSIEEVG
jgi:hypothetical protein